MVLRLMVSPAFLLLLPLLGCREPQPDVDELPERPSARQMGQLPTDTIERAIERALALTDSIEERLLPAPLLTPAEENALRSASNDVQLARSRELGVRVVDQATFDRLRSEGRLVPLEAHTMLWVTRELRSSQPYVTPDTRAMLVRVGERFQARLAAMGLPAYRVEVTSVLRTPESQAALRETNPNAAAGVSTHEFGTSLDIAYSGYGAPGSGAPSGDAAELIAALALERVAARYSRELQKVLGDVLRGLQSEGVLMVTLERQQPVYHLTVARPMAVPQP